MTTLRLLCWSILVFLPPSFAEDPKHAFYETLGQFQLDKAFMSHGLGEYTDGLRQPIPVESPQDDLNSFHGLSKRAVGPEKVNIIRLNVPPTETNNTGRVEVFYEGKWGTVCDKAWDLKDAQVVCSELGMVKAIHAAKQAKYGHGKGPVWLSEVQCDGKESSLKDCPSRGLGQVEGCSHADDAGVKCLRTGLPRLIEVGCYKDMHSNRALRHLYANLRHEIDWFNVRSMVTKCAERAYDRGYRYFGIQFYGECWGDNDGESRYDMHGEADLTDKSQKCYEGTGMHWANFVYKFAPWEDLGCWKDIARDRTLPQLLANFRRSLDWFNIGKTVDKCYQAAKKAGKKIFAVQFFGECWVGNDDSEEAYMKYGPSTKCWSGVGQQKTNYVYRMKW